MRLSDRAGGREGAERNPVFALDIGTRSVIGIVGSFKNDIFIINDMEIMEHERRSMADGQIEDIAQVSKVAGAVKAKLEERTGLSLDRVCIAAAGRTLKTQRAFYEREFDSTTTMTPELIAELELMAIDLARAENAKSFSDGEADNYYCVDHSIVKYSLDGYPLSTLLGHNGKKASVELIATFLPKEVVESLYSTMYNIGSEVENLTLEPIAAMNAIIPRELRMLNLALVDIGAGTSDIAVSNGGSVSAYTMATVAGDEVTEALIERFLVDFATAERIKREVSEKDEIRYTDILGLEYNLSASEIMECVGPMASSICKTIADKILEANEGRAPKAVFLVGGGSKTPGMRDTLADKLGMDVNKVAVGGNNYMKKMVQTDLDISAPEFATPVGIAITAVLNQSKSAFSVTINGGKARQLLKNNKVTLIELLLMNGYNYNHIIGRTGRRVICEVDGVKRIINGEPPIPAAITLNGESANISAAVHPGDEIMIKPAVSGKDAAPTVESLTGKLYSGTATINGESAQIGRLATVNGVEAEPGLSVANGDVIRVKKLVTIGDVLSSLGVDAAGLAFEVNGARCSLERVLEDGDVVRYYAKEAQAATFADKKKERPKRGKPAEEVAGQPLSVILNGEKVLLPERGDKPYLFLDMLNIADIDPKKPQGNIILKINGKNASYLEEVHEGDDVVIRWSKGC